MIYLIVLFISSLHANDIQTSILEHQNPGCPTNSVCSKEMGLFYKKWKKVLSTKNIKQIQSFYDKNGFPLELWILKKHEANNRILWDSRCKNHNEGDAYIKSALIRGKNFHALKNDSRYMTRKALVLSNNKISSFIISSTDLPLYNSRDGLVFLKSVDGHYFSHSLSVKGKSTFLKAKEPKEYPRTITCPKNLKKEYEKNKWPTKVYSGHFCQQIWNEASDGYDTIMTGWDCN